jgi:cellulose biosynthesis protein BcsQ
MKKNEIRLTKLPPDRIAKSKVIAVMNNKGGCGKTTTAIALGLHLSRAGHNVLFWDNDPQSNLTQRLGLPDGQYKDKRLNHFFRNVDLDNFETEQRKLSLIVEYPYLYRLKGAITPPGKIGIMAGSHFSEVEAKSARERLGLNTYFEPEQRNLFKRFHSGVKLYSDYFDYIVMDTAPAMEGNILCQLAARTADEIVSPVDGIEAATGIKGLMGWLYSETSPENGVRVRPNMLFAMVKYQEDTKNLSGINPNLKMRNAVYRVLKDVLGDYVCDNGIKELSSLRNRVYGGFGRKTDYDDLCNEVAFKMSMPRSNIFSHWNNIVSSRLEDDLSSIEMKTLEKRPTFKTPKFEYLNGVDKGVTAQV